MADEFKNLGKALEEAYSREAMKKMVEAEAPFRKMIAQQQQVNNVFGVMLPARTPKMNGDQIVQVETPDGPCIYEFVEEVNYLDNGGLEVNVLHAGNRTIEVFPKDHWTHCTTKHLVNEEDAAQAEKAKLAIAHALQPKIFKPNITFSKSLVDSLADVKLSPEERSSWLEWVKVKLKPKVTK